LNCLYSQQIFNNIYNLSFHGFVVALIVIVKDDGDNNVSSSCTQLIALNKVNK